jgi:hypothetical protein
MGCRARPDDAVVDDAIASILKRLLARYLGLAEHTVRVVPRTSAGLRAQGIVFRGHPGAVLARALGPVRFVETRRGT